MSQIVMNPENPLNGLPVRVVKRVPRHGYVVVELLRARRASDYRKGDHIHLPSQYVSEAV